MTNGLVRTKMAEAFVAACSPEQLAGKKLSRVARKVVHRVLTNKSAGVGVKFDPSRKKKQVSADSAVMKQAA